MTTMIIPVSEPNDSSSQSPQALHVEGSPRCQLPRRQRKKGCHTETTESPKPCHFSRLPFELLAEVLILTRSPKHVLAVARCSKFLCATLLRETSTFVWRNARKLCRPEPIPDPPSILSEASYAAFLFDAGICEVSRC